MNNLDVPNADAYVAARLKHIQRDVRTLLGCAPHSDLATIIVSYCRKAPREQLYLYQRIREMASSTPFDEVTRERILMHDNFADVLRALFNNEQRRETTMETSASSR